MSYITEGYYRRTYKGRYCGEDLRKLLDRACDLVDILTHGRINALGFGNLTKYQQGIIKKAICLMIDSFANVDGTPAVNLAGYSAYGMKVQNQVRKEKPWEVAGCGFWAWQMLMSTGLMRSVV
ncbi:MAG: hypothetical protein FWE33_01745 [Defluviitaleaceae bacterium]|nr:hypothetical protein [Defluviitaleaceae bacterium]